jgi:class 3 adenylate cyclase
MAEMREVNSIDREDWHRIMERFFKILTDGVHRFEGTVNEYRGDGIMALFGAPIAHEDHAACGWPPLWDVIVGRIDHDLRMDYTAQGLTVGLATRMEQLAAPGSAC